MVRRFALVLAASLLAGSVAFAQKPSARIDTVITSDSKETMAERSVFPPTQAKVYVFYMMADAAKGQKVKALWVAEKVEGEAPNNKFAEVEASSAGGTYWGSFSYPKPANGTWPIGNYRVDILIDGALASSAKFKIQK